MFELKIDRRVFKEMNSIVRSDQLRIHQCLQKIALTPFPAGKNPKKLSSQEAFRYRVGNYRILYTVEQKVVSVYAIRHRREAYKT